MLIWPLWYCGHFILAKSKVQSVIFFLFVKEPLPYGLAINTDNFFCGQWMTELKESRVAGAQPRPESGTLNPLMAAPFGWIMIAYRRLACKQTPTRKV